MCVRCSSTSTACQTVTGTASYGRSIHSSTRAEEDNYYNDDNYNNTTATA